MAIPHVYGAMDKIPGDILQAALSRRQLLTAGLAASALTALPGEYAEAKGGSALQQLITAGYVGTDLLGTPNGCMEWGIIGVFVVYGEVFFIITDYLPTGLIEVHKHVGGSIFYGGGEPQIGTINQGIAGARTEGGYEVRVWEILDRLRELMFEGYYNCLCKAQKTGGGGAPPGVLLSQIKTINEGNEACDAAGNFLEGLVDQVIDQVLGQLNTYVKLSYDSGIDTVNWRTGCRDIVPAFEQGAKIVQQCVLGVRPGQGGGGGQIFRDPVCVGTWGPLLPRQMRADGASPPVVAAHVGYRAIHIASRVTKRFPYLVTLNCKYEPIYPILKPFNCFFPGCSVHEVDVKVTNSKEGKFGFLWWSPQVCVKSESELQGCFGM
ncbi:hypothetical protein E4T66_17770 [Sinimarinibacterium sp. CAU 1509]|uniref:hypothetical protein n=1 Tax=Sinimarinibacterium sp. CAU 1509 TaxID=2562283 RepID=UPI0010ABB02F|nr:hypothetical protein [Sinimarinibacterium sp. CAU 1509]TJY57256.1 hypothetical protein E4T66_17770 [Sinimarinibacterium sp. CAU 1509]